MELIVIIITTLCITLSVMLTPCDSQQIQVQPSHDDEAKNLPAVPVLTLPRKLRLIEEAATMKINEGKEKEYTSSYYKPKGSLSGEVQHYKEANMVHGRGRTRQAWMEGTDDVSQFFTMDYSHVRRRRPIHNKSLPVAP